jgi:hypothetical protein
MAHAARPSAPRRRRLRRYLPLSCPAPGLLLCALLCALLAGAAAKAQAPPPATAGRATASTPVVVIPYVRDPVDKSYRRMLNGMARFERERALAPTATLRFRLLPRRPNTRMEDISLRIAGERLSIPVPIGPDLSFTLPRNEQALREDAAVLANRRTDSLTWRAWVVTPGLPPDTRRLGDLRLECRVGMEAGLISNVSKAFGWLSELLTSPEEVCNRADGNYLFFAERPIFSVSLRHGERHWVLPFKMLYAAGEQTADTLPYCDCQVMLDRTYYAPIWDRGWPDDTLVEFEYMEPERPGKGAAQ